jgi:hypothetical protein
MKVVSALPVEVAAFRQPARPALLGSAALAPFRLFLRLSATLFWAVANFGVKTRQETSCHGRPLGPTRRPEMLRELIWAWAWKEK